MNPSKATSRGMVTLDGSQGEGGGQILRSALSLAMITGKPLKMDRIRAGRKKPGLMRQHLTAVRAAHEICGVEFRGPEIGATSLTFVPGPVQPGRYEFSVGTAGSALLVLQTLLPPLMLAKEPSTLVLRGGTHNSMAPTYDFVESSFAPVLRRMGVGLNLSLDVHGFFPAGGGQVTVEVEPASRLTPLDLSVWSEPTALRGVALLSQLPQSIGWRECKALEEAMKPWPLKAEIQEVASPGPGNVVSAFIEAEHGHEVVVGFGERGRSAERVAASVAKAVRSYLYRKAPVGEYLADQLILPFALCGEGSFLTSTLSAHSLSNLEVVKAFLDFELQIKEQANENVILAFGS